MTCPLCTDDGGEVFWRDDFCRVVLVHDRQYPGFCRVILNEHVKEMTDLGVAEQLQLMRTVFAVERALRVVAVPDKINLASLGNQVPHLHWHVIPRFLDDAHFPDPIWGVPHRDGAGHPVQVARLREQLAELLGASGVRGR